MVKRLISISLIVIAATSCSKDDPIVDNFQPVITLVGNSDETVTLNSTYADKGATATDNTDGDISSSIVATGTIDVNKAGTYHKYYDVTDANGNKAARATRNIHVVNEADFISGFYTATSNCGATATASYNTTVTPSNSINNDIRISNVLGYGEVHGKVIGTTGITIETTVAPNGITYYGSGVISGNEFILSITDSTNSSTCAINHVR